jgi:hypothetical protein
MSHLESLLGGIAPGDREMAELLLGEIGTGESNHQTEVLTDNDPNLSEVSCPVPEYPSAASAYRDVNIAEPSTATPSIDNGYQFTENTIEQTVQSLPETAPAPTDLYSTNPDPDGWQWANENQDGTVLNNKWCTMDPEGKAKNVITALIHLDRDIDLKPGISIMLAFPAPSEEATQYWAEALNRSQAAEHIGKIVNTLNLPACRHQDIQRKDRARNSEGIANEEEWLTSAANSLVARFKFNEISGAGQSFPYKVFFRQARQWDNVINGHRYEKRNRYSMRTTLLHTSSRRHYELDAKQADGIFKKIKSWDRSRRKEAEE